MVVRPLSRVRLGASLRAGAPVEKDYIDLRDHRGPMRNKPSGSGPRRVQPPALEGASQLREIRLFGTPAFRRLWISQLLSSLGDWIGLIATIAIANRIAGEGGLSLVLAVRLGMAFVFASFAGVLADRMSRKRIMVSTYVGRALVFFCFLPFVDALWTLVLASILLELMTLMYSPAKEASVPNLVKPSFLPTANSLSLVAAYGTFPFAAGLFAILAKVPEWLFGDAIVGPLAVTPELVALYFNGLTYIASALVIATLALPHTKRIVRNTVQQSRAKAGFKEAAEGFQFVRENTTVRAVVFGLAAGLIGGASIVPLGIPFASDVLGAGSSGYGLLLTAMGTGLALGVVCLTVVFKHVPLERTFVLAIFTAGAALATGAAMNGLGAATACIGILGFAAGAIYVTGFTMLQMNVSDDIRGRVFATFYTLTRVCILLAIAAAPFVAGRLTNLSARVFSGDFVLFGNTIALPGVRLTLWLSAFIIFAAGAFVAFTFRSNKAVGETVDG